MAIIELHVYYLFYPYINKDDMRYKHTIPDHYLKNEFYSKPKIKYSRLFRHTK